MTAVVVALLVAGCAGSNAASSHEEVALRTAAAAMESASAYRFVADVVAGSTQVHLEGEFTAPDHVHERLVVGSSTPTELLFIGSQAYRQDGGGWIADPSNAGGPAGDPRTTFASLAKSGGVKADATGYHFTLTGDAARLFVGAATATTRVTGTATLEGGRISSLAYHADGPPPADVKVQYNGFDSVPPITAPPITLTAPTTTVAK